MTSADVHRHESVEGARSGFLARHRRPLALGRPVAQLRLAVGLRVFLIGAAGTVFVFLLAMKVYGAAGFAMGGFALGLLTVVPCTGLIALLIVNNEATKVLRQNGYTIGLLGAKL